VLRNTQLCPRRYKKVGLWHRTLDGVGGKWVQADRRARPSPICILLPVRRKPPTLLRSRRTMPVRPCLAHSLEHHRWVYARGINAGWLGLCCQTSSFMIPRGRASYPDNGRKLSDDVMDAFVSILSNGKVTRDNVVPTTTCLPLSRTSVRRTECTDPRKGGRLATRAQTRRRRHTDTSETPGNHGFLLTRDLLRQGSNHNITVCFGQGIPPRDTTRSPLPAALLGQTS